MDNNYRNPYKGPKITFRPNSKAYLALTYAKMKSEPFTSLQLKKCLAGAFNSVDNAQKALRILENNKCVERADGGKWIITNTGYSVIMHIGQSRKVEITRGPG